ncbi:DUF2971 domain-containing protein [Aeromonas veronii]
MAPPSRLEGFREGRGWGRIPPVLLHGGGRNLNSMKKMASKRKIKTYYKYTKFHHEPGQTDYLRDFHLRISLPKTLNDPFEGSINNDLERKLLERIRPEFHGLHALMPYMPMNKIMELMENNYRVSKDIIGTISLSESPSNLLMWAHYANEHNGICIGFKNDFLEKNIAIKDSATALKPIRVHYSTTRPNEILYTDDPMYDLNTQMIDHITNKSIEWEHEQEHRCIISPKQAERIKILWPSENDNQIYSLIKENNMNKIGENLYEGEGIESISANFSESKNLAFLKRISPSSISSIYFGCRFPKEQKDIIIKEINENKDQLNHISIYECTASKYEFKLDIEKIR